MSSSPTTRTDLGPAATRMASVLGAITDEQLAGPTPCPRYTVGDLVEHVGGLTLAFTAAAAKETPPADGPGSQLGDAANLPADWRTAFPTALAALAEAWRDPAAWDGMTVAGPVEMPASVAGLVALEELVVHGWDLAAATGQPYEADEPSLELVRSLVVDFAPADDPQAPEVDDGTLPFGRPVEVPADAPALHHVLGLTGRDPAWQPA